MATLTIRGGGLDIPDTICSECEMVFNICWNRNLIYDRVEYCPFCGDEVEEIIHEDEDQE